MRKLWEMRGSTNPHVYPFISPFFSFPLLSSHRTGVRRPGRGHRGNGDPASSPPLFPLPSFFFGGSILMNGLEGSRGRFVSSFSSLPPFPFPWTLQDVLNNPMADSNHRSTIRPPFLLPPFSSPPFLFLGGVFQG